MAAVTSEIKWTRTSGVYVSKDGKYVIKNAGNGNWYLFIDDNSNFWNVNEVAYSTSLQGIKAKAEINAKVGA